MRESIVDIDIDGLSLEDKVNAIIAGLIEVVEGQNELQEKLNEVGAGGEGFGIYSGGE